MKITTQIYLQQVLVKNDYITIVIKQNFPSDELHLFNYKNKEMFLLQVFTDLERALKYAKKFIKEQTIEELESRTK